jgi:riboflavin synthase
VFTGLVEGTAAIRRLERRGSGARLFLAPPGFELNLALGDSLAVSGCCLTVAGFEACAAERPAPSFDLSAETLQRTWFGSARPGRLVNLERSLRLDQRLGGHLVSGHVDGLARVLSVVPSGDGGACLEFELEAPLDRYLIHKGSIALDGVSLTVNGPRAGRFAVAVIPHTLAVTSLGQVQAGDRLHAEADQIAKWIERLMPLERSE